MAEYYPLLARAVAGLGSSTPEIRRGIYERARKALLGQLQSIDPPVPEEDIERESRALDAAVEKLEAELAAKELAKPMPITPAPGTVRPTAPARPLTPRVPLTPRPLRPLEPRKPDVAGKDSSAPGIPRPTAPAGGLKARPAAVASAAATARPAGIAREAPSRMAAPLPERRTAPAPHSEAAMSRQTALEARPHPDAAAQTAVPPAPGTGATVSDPASVAAAGVAARQSPALRDNLREFSRPREALMAEFEWVMREQDATSPPILPAARGEPIRPIAQRPLETERRSLRHWIIGTVVFVVVAVVAIMAFILRDNPADLVRRTTPAPTADNSQGPGKITARIGVADAPPTSASPTAATASAPATAPAASAPPPATAPAASASSAETTAAAPATAPASAAATTATGAAPVSPFNMPIGNTPSAAPAAQPAPATAPTAPAQAAPAAQPAPAPQTATTTTTPAATNPAIPVAQRAALIVDAANAQQQVQTYVGTVVWSLENVTKGSGQPPAEALRADIDIPGVNFKASMELEKNTDSTLPASHTIELKFIFGPNSPIPAVQRIDTPFMRDQDQPQGDPLVGAAQQVVPNYFLVALTQGDAVQARNLSLLTSRGWMDVPILLADGRVAKLTFEKGTSGDQDMTSALAAWQK